VSPPLHVGHEIEQRRRHAGRVIEDSLRVEARGESDGECAIVAALAAPLVV
jgi:hypothetical protein